LLILLCAPVQAYDSSGVAIGSVAVAGTEVVVTRIEEATDLDVARQLEGTDLLAAGMEEEEDLEDDFVVVANQPDEDEDAEWPTPGQFHSVSVLPLNTWQSSFAKFHQQSNNISIPFLVPASDKAPFYLLPLFI
jgi:hypothetical protein